MSRYRRVNIDGQSLYKTETRLAAAALLPGTFAVINGDDKFAQAAATVGRLYVIDCATTRAWASATPFPLAIPPSATTSRRAASWPSCARPAPMPRTRPSSWAPTAWEPLPRTTPTWCWATARTMP